MGRPSGPAFSFRVAANRNQSVAPEGLRASKTAP
ncbi:DUF6053 domain-containing protein [Lysobacter enzymogenes]